MSASEEVGKKADFSGLYQTTLTQAQSTASAGKVDEACEMLLNVEKQARLANDLPTLKSVCASLLELCATHAKWTLLKENVTLLSKRRAQKSSVIAEVVQKAMTYLESTDSESTKQELIEALRVVAEGKMFLEKERATLTQMLSQMKEARGEIDEAATVLQEVHVETFGAMTKLEKTEFILEQVRLTLLKKDYVRANILSKKILRRTLEEDGFQQCKLKFYKLMIEYDTHEDETLELCRHWLSIFHTDIVQEDESKWTEALEHAAIFVVLSPHSNLQSDLLHSISREIKLEKLADFEALLKNFTTREVMTYPLSMDQTLQKHAVFTQERGEEWKTRLHTRVTEHNIRVVAEHYERIRLPHLADMLGLPEDVTERSISNLVSDGAIYAKIDRPAKLISFLRPQSPEEQLSDWSADVSQLLRLVETTCHLINKETMVHKI